MEGKKTRPEGGELFPTEAVVAVRGQGGVPLLSAFMLGC